MGRSKNRKKRRLGRITKQYAANIKKGLWYERKNSVYTDWWRVVPYAKKRHYLEYLGYRYGSWLAALMKKQERLMGYKQGKPLTKHPKVFYALQKYYGMKLNAEQLYDYWERPAEMGFDEYLEQHPGLEYKPTKPKFYSSFVGVGSEEKLNKICDEGYCRYSKKLI